MDSVKVPEDADDTVILADSLENLQRISVNNKRQKNEIYEDNKKSEQQGDFNHK